MQSSESLLYIRPDASPNVDQVLLIGQPRLLGDVARLPERQPVADADALSLRAP
jgi:hypothetical protein